MSEQRITVAIRIRPPLDKERYETLCARKADDDQTIIIKPEETAANMGEPVAFQFDNVFDEHDGQLEVYEECVQEMVDHALSGFNTTVFTYGQTGSGKTFTILGQMSRDGAVSEYSGMFLRVFHDLFNYKEAMRGRVHIVITLSALELYVDEVMDLLQNKNKLKLRETPDETLTMGIRVVEVVSMVDVVKNFEIANSFRSVTATKMNDVSSRSHALFFIDLFQAPADKCDEMPPLEGGLINAQGSPVTAAAPGLIRSRIALVDLAGSERVKRSGVTGQGMTEAQAINKSLSTLGTVINAMYVQSPHIPFRESKLTKLLKNSLVDTTSRLLLIGQVAPPTNSAQESLSTLRFCDRVKGLKAGQVMGFTDPAEEERYLHSLRVSEELAAEMRILRAEYYYKPVNLRALAAEKGTTVAAEKEAVVQNLQAGAADLFARKEREEVAEMERQAAGERDQAIEGFVLHMNALIEEYEAVAVAAKKERKALKRLGEELEAEQEAKVTEAKRAKKGRVKLEEACVQLRVAVEASAAEEQAADAELAGGPSHEADNDHEDNSDGATGSVLTPEMEAAVHQFVESYHNNCTDLSSLWTMYAIRLTQTARQRHLARRQKLLSSTLVTDSTLLYDTLAFLVDRAVDIAEGDVPMHAKWSWHDVDGLSRQLLNAEQLYPPLLEQKEENTLNQRLAENRKPVREQFHKITFLSSDDSDDENSHHAAESRQQRKIKIRNGVQVETTSSEDESGSDGDEYRREGGEGDEGDAPMPRAANWLKAPGDSENMDGDKAPASDDDDGEDEVDEDRDGEGEHKKRKRRKKSDTDAGAGAAVVAAGEKPSEASTGPGADEVAAAAAPEADGDDEGVELDRRKKRRKKPDVPEGDRDGAAALSPAEDDSDPVALSLAYGPDGQLLPRPGKLSPEEVDRLYVTKVYDSPRLIHELLKFLRSGAVMLKHGRRGSPHSRLFWINITQQKRELLWRDPEDKKSSPSVINLNEVSYIQLGAFSKVFHRKPIAPCDPSFFRCFTIGLKKDSRTVDVVAGSIPDYEAWVVGLSHLVAVDPAWGGKLDVTKESGYQQLNYFESILCEQHYLTPNHYLALKKAVMNVAKRTIEVLQECGNDPAKAFQFTGGIHLPGINDKGAVYLTKGELRYLCPELKLDIFRITHIWMHFQHTHLVYDDFFVPATPFGVTRRE